MKQLEVLLLPPGWDTSPVHGFTSISLSFPNYPLVPINSPRWGTVRFKCLAQEHNTMTWPGLNPDLSAQSPAHHGLGHHVSHKIWSWNILRLASYLPLAVVFAQKWELHLIWKQLQQINQWFHARNSNAAWKEHNYWWKHDMFHSPKKIVLVVRSSKHQKLR